MLTLPERIAFVVLALLCGALAIRGFARIVAIVRKGAKADRADRLLQRFAKAFVDIGLQRTIFRARPLVSTLHAFIFFGFSFYLLVNVNDLLEGYVAGWTTSRGGALAAGFNLFSDLFSVLILVGMISLLVRRFVGRPRALRFNPSVLLQPGVGRGGVRRDSLIVGTFILLHVGGRWVGSAFRVAEVGHPLPSMPTASALAVLFSGMSPGAVSVGAHVCWWLAMGLIVVFLPYFPRSKHLHLMAAPINLALGRTGARGRLDAVADASSPGAGALTDLGWPQLLHSYACIMCNRCQEVCPAHSSGTPLSPAALEINKRYWLNEHGAGLLAGAPAPRLLEVAASADAVWSCTTCMACVRVCPVGDEPMADLVSMRRRLVFDGEAPAELAQALKNLDEQGNSFGESARKRARWTKGLPFEIPDARKEEVEYLWFVGDFASYNPQCQEISRTVARLLNAAGVRFGIAFEAERSAGNDVRRAGEEGLFETLAQKNVEMLSKCKFEKILTTDPHTFNALTNEYPIYGGRYEVVHHSTLLRDLVRAGRIPLARKLGGRATYHDPCYLGRYNGGFEAPREVIQACGIELVEMPRNRENSFCCGAGGGRIWMKDHPDVKERPSENRIREALSLGNIDHFVVSCPKDLTMYRDAVKTTGNEAKIAVREIADLLAEAAAVVVKAEAA